MQLADEAIALAKQRSALAGVAQDFEGCQAGLQLVIADLLANSNSTSDFNTTNSQCNSADNSFQCYLTNYPNG